MSDIVKDFVRSRMPAVEDDGFEQRLHAALGCEPLARQRLAWLAWRLPLLAVVGAVWLVWRLGGGGMFLYWGDGIFTAANAAAAVLWILAAGLLAAAGAMAGGHEFRTI
jgi:hypothetical protein